MKRIRTKRDYSICIGNIVLQGGDRRLLSVDTGIFYGTLYQYGKPLADARGVFCGNGMFPPVTQLTKYGVAMAGIILIIHLIEWVDKNCRARYAAVTAGAVTTLISLGGNLLSVKGRGYITTSILEGIFIFAVVSLGCRVLHMLLHGKEIMEIAKEEDREKSNVY